MRWHRCVMAGRSARGGLVIAALVVGSAAVVLSGGCTGRQKPDGVATGELQTAGEGGRLLRRKCTLCHVRPEVAGRSPARWRAILGKHRETVRLEPVAWRALEALVPEARAGGPSAATLPAGSASQPAAGQETP